MKRRRCFADTTLCSLLVERYHRAFDDELPRLARLARFVAAGARNSTTTDAGAAVAVAAVVRATVELGEALAEHVLTAEQSVHPALGTTHAADAVRAHLAEHERLLALLVRLMRSFDDVDTARLAPSHERVFRALRDGVRTLRATMEEFFSLEQVLEITNLVDDALPPSSPATRAIMEMELSL